jgi:hemerythrin
MAKVEWDMTYSVSVPEMDEQHKKLFSLINDFYDNIKIGQNKETLLPIINGLNDYAGVHFKAEEAVMAKYKYPELDMHKKLHEEFVAKAVDLKNRLESGRLVISLEVTSFIMDWLVKHIKGADKKYGEFISMRK